MFDAQMLELLGQGILETLYMTIASTLAAYILGIPIGIALVVIGVVRSKRGKDDNA